LQERQIFDVGGGSSQSASGVNAYARTGGEEEFQLGERLGAGVEKPAATGEDPVEIIHEDLKDSVRVLRQVFAAGFPRGCFGSLQLDQRDSAGIGFAVDSGLDEVRYPEVVHFHTYPGVNVVDGVCAGEVEVGIVLFGAADVEEVR
jgi:hypothetical protein